MQHYDLLRKFTEISFLKNTIVRGYQAPLYAFVEFGGKGNRGQRGGSYQSDTHDMTVEISGALSEYLTRS